MIEDNLSLQKLSVSEISNANELDKLLSNWTSTAMGRRAFLASVPILLASCATKQHRQREGDNSGQVTSMTVEDEKRLTQEALPEMRKDYPAVQDPKLQSYITNLGNKITRANSLEGKPYNYNFTVVDVPYVNAFALPAGTVFITAPLINMAENEAELAGVVGHEIGHVKARHSAERMEKAKEQKGSSWLYGASGGILGGLFGLGVGKLACPPKDTKCLAKATVLGAGAGVAGGLLVQKYKFMANSREDEMEADRIGFRTTVAAGYHKDHVGTFYEKLLAMEQQSKKESNPLLSSVADAFTTHPPSQQRVNQMHELAAAEKSRKNTMIGSKGFDEAKRAVENLIKSKKS